MGSQFCAVAEYKEYRNIKTKTLQEE